MGRHAQGARALGALWIAGLCAACVSEIPGESPPEDVIYYPFDVVVAPDQAHAYVVSSNFDRRFRTGWISVIDLDAALSGSRHAIVQQLKVPSLGAQLGLSDDGQWAVAAFRGADSAVALIEIEPDGASLSCGDAGDGSLSTELAYSDCDARHLRRLRADDFGLAQSVSLADPLAVAVVPRPDDPSRHVAVVGHASTRYVTLYDVEPDAHGLTPVRAVSLDESGVAALAPHPGLSHGTFVAAVSQVTASNVRSSIYNIDVGAALTGASTPRDVISLAEEVGGLELQDIVFSPDGAWAYAANRAPDAVLTLDTRVVTRLTDERPAYDVVAALPVAGRPTALVYLQRSGADLVVATSFAQDSLYFWRVSGGELTLAARLDNIGQGPMTLAAAQRGGRDLLLVTTFFNHGVTVVDVTGEDPSAYGVIALVPHPEDRLAAAKVVRR